MTNNKCNKCSKRIKIMCFECKCDGVFCITHKNPESHDCTYDFKTLGNQDFIKNNPQIISQKIIKI